MFVFLPHNFMVSSSLHVYMVEPPSLQYAEFRGGGVHRRPKGRYTSTCTYIITYNFCPANFEKFILQRTSTFYNGYKNISFTVNNWIFTTLKSILFKKILDLYLCTDVKITYVGFFTMSNDSRQKPRYRKYVIIRLRQTWIFIGAHRIDIFSLTKKANSIPDLCSN